MSEERNVIVTAKPRGRRPTPARTERGRQIMAHLQERGLTLHAAAKKARVSFQVLYNAIHDDPAKLSVKTVAALCGRLGLPLPLVAPQLAALVPAA